MAQYAYFPSGYFMQGYFPALYFPGVGEVQFPEYIYSATARQRLYPAMSRSREYDYPFLASVMQIYNALARIREYDAEYRKREYDASPHKREHDDQ
jgi:hypothetical protein